MAEAKRPSPAPPANPATVPSNPAPGPSNPAPGAPSPAPITKVNEVKPNSVDVNLEVTVLNNEIICNKGKKGGPRAKMQVALCKVSDETGIIDFRAKNEQVGLMKEHTKVIIRKAKAEVIGGSLFLVGGSVEVAPPKAQYPDQVAPMGNSNLVGTTAWMGGPSPYVTQEELSQEFKITKVEELQPNSVDVNLEVTVLHKAIVKKGRKGEAHCFVSDETGFIHFIAKNEQVGLMKVFTTVILRKVKTEVSGDSFVLVGGSVELAPPVVTSNFKKKDSKVRLPDPPSPASKIEHLRPKSTGATLTVKVLTKRSVAPGISECLVRDDTGMIIFTARYEQEDLMEEGATVILHKAKVVMFKGSMRLAVDRSGIIEVAEHATFVVKEDNNLSIIEWVRVDVEEVINDEEAI